MINQARATRSAAAPRAARFAVLLCCAGLAACVSHSDITGSISGDSPILSEDAARPQLDALQRRYAASSTDRVAALNYALALRANGRHAQAVAILEAAAIRYPQDPAVLGAYGKALADDGRLQEAARVLDNAQSPQHPNWSILSAQGAVADQLGNHAQAQAFYTTALKIAPGEPSVLSNLGLSYALSKQLALAESTLREAAASPGADRRVRQNLALVLALRGKFAEAEQIGRRDLPESEAKANVDAIRSMIKQSDPWRRIQQADAKGAIDARPN